MHARVRLVHHGGLELGEVGELVGGSLRLGLDGAVVEELGPDKCRIAARGVARQRRSPVGRVEDEVAVRGDRARRRDRQKDGVQLLVAVRGAPLPDDVEGLCPCPGRCANGDGVHVPPVVVGIRGAKAPRVDGDGVGARQRDAGVVVATGDLSGRPVGPETPDSADRRPPAVGAAGRAWARGGLRAGGRYRQCTEQYGTDKKRSTTGHEKTAFPRRQEVGRA